LPQGHEEVHDAPVPPGDYEVSVTLVNRGKSSERFLTEGERFDRDDLERYEVLLRRQESSAE
jgi:hypothetical protein